MTVCVASNRRLVVVERTMREASVAGLLHGIRLGVTVAHVGSRHRIAGLHAKYVQREIVPRVC